MCTVTIFTEAAGNSNNNVLNLLSEEHLMKLKHVIVRPVMTLLSNHNGTRYLRDSSSQICVIEVNIRRWSFWLLFPPVKYLSHAFLWYLDWHIQTDDDSFSVHLTEHRYCPFFWVRFSEMDYCFPLAWWLRELTQGSADTSISDPSWALPWPG